MITFKETRLENIIADFKHYKKQLLNTFPVSKEFWILLQCGPINATGENQSIFPFYKVEVSGLTEAVLNHEMYQQMNMPTSDQQPYSFVFFGKNLIFLITYAGLIYNKDGNEIDIQAVQVWDRIKNAVPAPPLKASAARGPTL
jgi:hypothetical protein